MEIGLNESILFLQWEFWLVTEGVLRDDGFWWLRRTVREIAELFPFWSPQTAQRTVESLILQGLFVAGDFDEGPGKRARWIRFDFDRCSMLNSIRVLSHSETTNAQSETGNTQNETTVLYTGKRKDKKKEPVEIESPPFNSSEFTEALALFEKQRSQKKAGKLTEVARKLFYRDLTQWGERRAIAALLHSARNGYTGCFEPKNGNYARSENTSAGQQSAGNAASGDEYDPFKDKPVY